MHAPFPKKASLRSSSRAASTSQPATGRIHPVNLTDLEHLDGWIARIDGDKALYDGPITMVDCKTRAAEARSLGI